MKCTTEPAASRVDERTAKQEVATVQANFVDTSFLGDGSTPLRAWLASRPESLGWSDAERDGARFLGRCCFVTGPVRRFRRSEGST